MSGRIEFNFGFSTTAAVSRPNETDPMKILVLGDFSASSSRTKDKTLAARRIHPVDIDNLETLISKHAPQVELDLDNGGKTSITFSAMDDFHPDRLYQRLDIFDKLRDIRQGLSKQETYSQAADELRRIQLSTAESERSKKLEDKEEQQQENDSTTFERLLGQTTGNESRTGQHARSAVENLIGAAIKDHIVVEPSAEQVVYAAAADDAASQLMRQVLHHPEFKAVEALWRGVDFLIRRIETDELLQVYILDVSIDEIKSDFLENRNNLEQSDLFQRLVTQGVQTPGNSPWSLIIGAYTFDASPVDVAVLAALGTVASQAGGPFLAAASSSILGCGSLVETPNPHDWQPDEQAADNWNALRQCAVSPWIGLALPGFLLRLPYGENTDEIDAFAFEETDSPGNSSQLLWGNPAFACAQLIAQAFTERGWQLQPGDIPDIGELPAYSYQADGEWHMTPCAETLLPETAFDAILKQGLIPLVSLKNTNTVRVPAFPSIATPARALNGPWHTASRNV